MGLLRKSKNIIISVGLVAILGACLLINTKEQSTAIPEYDELPVLQNEKLVRITVPSGWNSFKIGDPVVLMVQNISKEVLVFLPDYSIQIYANESDGWIFVENKMSYVGTESIELNPSMDFDPTKIGETYLFPDLPIKNSGVILKIFIQGQGKDTGKEIIASTELTLYPK